MSDRPQTTRNKIMCIMNTDNAQIMFLDTPGIHKPQHKLGQYMVRAAESTLHEVDVVLFVVDVSENAAPARIIFWSSCAGSKPRLFLLLIKLINWQTKVSFSVSLKAILKILPLRQ